MSKHPFEKFMHEEHTNNHLGFQFKIEEIDKSSIVNGQKAHIIYLIVDNSTSKRRNIRLSIATYVTSKREQIEQDIWLSGYITGNDVLQPNSYKKAGIIFYTHKLKTISIDDILYISIDLPKEGNELTVCFKNSGEQWEIIDIDISETEIKLTPKQIQNGLLKKIERIEAFEEKLGIRFENISIKIVNDSNDFTLYCEAHSTSGTSIDDYIKIECVLYDGEGMVLEKRSNTLSPSNFFGFEVLEFNRIGNAAEVSKIRIYPKK